MALPILGLNQPQNSELTIWFFIKFLWKLGPSLWTTHSARGVQMLKVMGSSPVAVYWLLSLSVTSVLWPACNWEQLGTVLAASRLSIHYLTAKVHGLSMQQDQSILININSAQIKWTTIATSKFSIMHSDCNDLMYPLRRISCSPCNYSHAQFFRSYKYVASSEWWGWDNTHRNIYILTSYSPFLVCKSQWTASTNTKPFEVNLCVV